MSLNAFDDIIGDILGNMDASDVRGLYGVAETRPNRLGIGASAKTVADITKDESREGQQLRARLGMGKVGREATEAATAGAAAESGLTTGSAKSRKRGGKNKRGAAAKAKMPETTDNRHVHAPAPISTPAPVAASAPAPARRLSFAERNAMSTKLR